VHEGQSGATGLERVTPLACKVAEWRSSSAICAWLDANRRIRNRQVVDLPSPDGLELRGNTLYVVGGGLVTVVRLGARLASGVVLGEITDPGLDVPTTATVAAGRLWVVNARFTTPPTPATEYWITQLPLRPGNA
jgi:hypothetical protein